MEEFLGRGHYPRGERRRVGWRNGYEPLTVKSEAGPLALSRPKLRATEKAYEFRLPAGLGKTTAELEALATREYVRGLSTRDVAGLYGEVFRGKLSRSAVSRAVAQLEEQFQAWRRRELSHEEIVYLFLDGQYHALRSGTREKERVLTAYGIRADGRPVLLHLATGPRESRDAWLGALHELVERGLGEPLLVLFDGNPGLRKAVREVFPNARRQRCQVHKMRNLLAKLPRLAQSKDRWPDGRRRVRKTRFSVAVYRELMYATLIAASATWRGVRMTPKIQQALDQLRGEPTRKETAAAA